MSNAFSKKQDGELMALAAVAAERAATQQKTRAKAATVAALNAIAGIVYHRERDAGDDRGDRLCAFQDDRSTSGDRRPGGGAHRNPGPRWVGSAGLGPGAETSPYGTMFRIESRGESGVWTILGSTNGPPPS